MAFSEISFVKANKEVQRTSPSIVRKQNNLQVAGAHKSPLLIGHRADVFSQFSKRDPSGYVEQECVRQFRVRAIGAIAAGCYG